MNDQKKHILLCDDDISLSNVLSDYLKNAGFAVDVVNRGEDMLQKVRKSYYDVCILDINMPSMSGFEVLEELRGADLWVPVIVLTARQAREDVIRAFQLGCDDYVIKPFSMDILICRINAIIRRFQAGKISTETEFTLGSKVFDSVRQTIDGIHMSSRESDLLLMLCRSMDQLVERHVILTTLWQSDDYFSSRSLSVYINHLRGYLENTGMRIIGVHGRGYKLVKEEK